MRNVLLVCFLFLGACGGGLGDFGIDPGSLGDVAGTPGGNESPPDPTPPTTAGLGEVFLDGPQVAEVGETYEAILRVPDGAGFTALNKPRGMEIDSSSGAVRWTPEADQVKTHTIALDLDGERVELSLAVQGRARLAQQQVGAVAGGVIDINAPAKSVHGSRLLIASGALENDAEITVDLLLNRADLPVGVPALDFGPAQSFRGSVTLEFAYTDAMLKSAGITDERELAIWHYSPEAGSFKMLDSTVDTARRRVTAQLEHFSIYLLFVRNRNAVETEQTKELDPWLPPKSETGCGDYLAAMSFVQQPAKLYVIKGAKFGREKTNAIVIHGLASRTDCLPGLIQYAKRHYDNVWAFNYPSREPIYRNGLRLALELLKAGHEPGSSIDIYAHSMGGLVARMAIEKAWAIVAAAGLRVRNLVTLGTPHLGASPGGLSVARAGGIGDLRPNSEFLRSLNLDDGVEVWTEYHLVAGYSEWTSDGVVAVSSAAPTGLFPRQTILKVVRDHSGLHMQFNESKGGASVIRDRAKPGRLLRSGIQLLSSGVLAGPIEPGDPATREYVRTLATLRFDDSESFSLPATSAVRLVWRSPDGQDLLPWIDDGIQQYVFLPAFLEAQFGILPGFHYAPPQGTYEFNMRRDRYPTSRVPPNTTWELWVEIGLGSTSQPIVWKLSPR